MNRINTIFLNFFLLKSIQNGLKMARQLENCVNSSPYKAFELKIYSFSTDSGLTMQNMYLYLDTYWLEQFLIRFGNFKINKLKQNLLEVLS